MVPIITINTYLGYAIAMLTIFGIAFELPLGFVLLNLARVLTHERFAKWRRMIIFGVFAVRRGLHAEPGPDQHAAAGRAVRGAGRAGRGVRVLQRPAAGPLLAADPFPGLSPDEVAEFDLEDHTDSAIDAGSGPAE